MKIIRTILARTKGDIRVQRTDGTWITIASVPAGVFIPVEAKAVEGHAFIRVRRSFFGLFSLERWERSSAH